MNPSSNSPELSPQSHPENIFPELEAVPAPQTPEVVERGQERQAEQTPERDTTDNQVTLPADQSQPVDATPTPLAQDQATTTPATADDVDVIEKAWVDRAKQIIKETKDDPRAQEAAFEQLQIEYHKKRYGRDIKATR